MTGNRHIGLATQAPETRPPLDGELEAAARAFLPNATHLSAVGSGTILRVETGESAWAVRRWPAGTSAGKIRFVHDLLRACRHAGIEVVPDIATTAQGEAILSRDGRLYDAQRWLSGGLRARLARDRGPLGEQVNLPGTVPAPVQQALIETVARIHQVGAALAGARGVPRLSLEEMVQAVEGAWERARVRLRPAAPHRPVIQRWIRSGERALRIASRDLLDHPDVSQRLSVVGHFDLWPAHVLVSRDDADGGARLTGIVDWTDAAAGSPLLDLAQLVTHFGGWTAQLAEEAIATYAGVARLEPDERRLLPAVAALDLIGECAWLLSVAYAQDEPPSTALRDGVEALVESLERVVDVAALGDRPRAPLQRRWVHREPPRPARNSGDQQRAPTAPARGSTARRGDGPGRSRRGQTPPARQE